MITNLNHVYLKNIKINKIIICKMELNNNNNNSNFKVKHLCKNNNKFFHKNNKPFQMKL